MNLAIARYAPDAVKVLVRRRLQLVQDSKVDADVPPYHEIQSIDDGRGHGVNFVLIGC